MTYRVFILNLQIRRTRRFVVRNFGKLATRNFKKRIKFQSQRYPFGFKISILSLFLKTFEYNDVLSITKQYIDFLPKNDYEKVEENRPRIFSETWQDSKIEISFLI